MSLYCFMEVLAWCYQTISFFKGKAFIVISSVERDDLHFKRLIPAIGHAYM